MNFSYKYAFGLKILLPQEFYYSKLSDYSLNLKQNIQLTAVVDNTSNGLENVFASIMNTARTDYTLKLHQIVWKQWAIHTSGPTHRSGPQFPVVLFEMLYLFFCKSPQLYSYIFHTLNQLYLLLTTLPADSELTFSNKTLIGSPGFLSWPVCIDLFGFY